MVRMLLLYLQQILRFNGSASLSLQGRGRASGKRQQPGAQEFHTGLAIHLPFQHLQPVDVPLDGTVAPLLLHGCLHRLSILL
jgi:hypothetical protein